VREIKVKDMIAAIRQNGLKQAFGHLFVYEDNLDPDTLNAACALGQAMINLDLRGKSFRSPDYGGVDMVENIVYLNDSKMYSLPQIADRLEEIYSKRMEGIVYIADE